MQKVENLDIRAGRLLVIPHKKDRLDVLVVQESGKSVSIATVVKAADGVPVHPGDEVVYDRLHATEIMLLDENGDEQEYRFLLDRDIAGVFRQPNHITGREKLFSLFQQDQI